jgi:radial spoke head protein 4A
VRAEPTQDLTADAPLLEWAGVSLGAEESFRLHLALKHLALKFPARNLRFWGKVQGIAGDYVVAEGELDGDDEDATDARGNAIEKTGEGANKYTYFVCGFAGDAWVKLPNVTPHQVAVARKLRRLVTGRLDAPVGGHPPFPGKEAGYLRAIIALVTADTVVSPVGVYVASEEEGSNDVNLNEEEFDAADIATLDGWNHHTLALNALGRVKPNPPKTNADGEEIEDPDAPAPSVPLRPVAEDGEGAWALRGYPRVGAGEDDAPKIVVLRSALWPGAFAVGSGKRFVNAYVGNGLPAAPKRYEPAIPFDVPAEFAVDSEEAPFREQADVIVDPSAGKAAAGEGEGEGEEDE